MDEQQNNSSTGQVDDAEDIKCLVAAGTALQRLFYLQLLVALVVLYLLVEALGFSVFATDEGNRVRQAVDGQLVTLEPLLVLNDALYQDPRTAADYQQFLAPFAAIESTAVTAIVGADVSSAEWKKLDPRDLDRAGTRTTRSLA